MIYSDQNRSNQKYWSPWPPGPNVALSPEVSGDRMARRDAREPGSRAPRNAGLTPRRPGTLVTALFINPQIELLVEDTNMGI